MSRLVAFALLAFAVLAAGVAAYLAAVEVSFRMLGGAKLSDEHRRLLDQEAW